MSSENYEYKFYQNFVITWNNFYDNAGRTLNTNNFNYFTTGGTAAANPVQPYVTKRGDSGFTPFENLYTNPNYVLEPTIGSGYAGNGNLSLFFDLSLNPPKTNPKKIVIKNLSSSFTNTNGTSFLLTCNNIWKYPIQFLDSTNNSIIYEEYKDTPLDTLQARVNLQRLSGTNPLQTVANQPYYISNPSLNFSIVYEYW